MLSTILGLLGLGGIGAFGVGLALRFGLLSFIPGAIANLLIGFVEFVFRLAAWAVESFFEGNTNIFKTWQAGFALVCWIVMAMFIGPEPVKAVMKWSPWHIEFPAADRPENMPRKQQSKGIFDDIKKSLGLGGSNSQADDDEHTRSLLRHPLGGA